MLGNLSQVFKLTANFGVLEDLLLLESFLDLRNHIRSEGRRFLLRIDRITDLDVGHSADLEVLRATTAFPRVLMLVWSAWPATAKDCTVDSASPVYTPDHITCGLLAAKASLKVVSERAGALAPK